MQTIKQKRITTSEFEYKLTVVVAPILKVGNPLEYDVTLEYRPHGRSGKFSKVEGVKNFYELINTTKADQQASKMEAILKHISIDEIYELKMQLWEALKPTKY